MSKDERIAENRRSSLDYSREDGEKNVPINGATVKDMNNLTQSQENLNHVALKCERIFVWRFSQIRGEILIGKRDSIEKTLVVKISIYSSL